MFLRLIPLWGKAAIALAVLAALYGGYRVWRHQVWIDGRNAALEEVARQNQRASEAAERVRISTDACFDQGGTWDVTTGECVLGGITPSGVRGLFGQ